MKKDNSIIELEQYIKDLEAQKFLLLKEKENIVFRLNKVILDLDCATNVHSNIRKLKEEKINQSSKMKKIDIIRSFAMSCENQSFYLSEVSQHFKTLNISNRGLTSLIQKAKDFTWKKVNNRYFYTMNKKKGVL